jgi:hypothetical protein
MNRLVDIMAALELRFVQERAEDGTLSYRLDPSVLLRSIILFFSDDQTVPLTFLSPTTENEQPISQFRDMRYDSWYLLRWAFNCVPNGLCKC